MSRAAGRIVHLPTIVADGPWRCLSALRAALFPARASLAPDSSTMFLA